MDSKYKTKAQNLTDHFSSLVTYVEKIAFPDYRDGILTPQDMSNLSRMRQWLYQIAHTTLSIDNQSLWKMPIYLIWAYSAAASLAFGIIFIQPNLYNLIIPNTQPYSLANGNYTVNIT